MAMLMLIIGLILVVTAAIAYLQPSLHTFPDRPVGDRDGKAEEGRPVPVDASGTAA